MNTNTNDSTFGLIADLTIWRAQVRAAARAAGLRKQWLHNRDQARIRRIVESIDWMGDEVPMGAFFSDNDVDFLFLV